MTVLTAIATDAEVELQCETGAISLDDLIAQITPAWLTAALSQRYPGVVVESAAIGRVLAGCSVKLWTHMTYNAAGGAAGLPAVMVVKAGFARHDPIMLFTYESEMRAYREVLPRHPINAPACYYAGPSPDGESSAIIIEDLTLRQARFCHATRTLDYAEAAAFLDAFARFHATSWNHPGLGDGSFRWAVDQAAAAAGLGAYQAKLVAPASWDMFMGLPRSFAVPAVLRERTRFLAALDRMVALGNAEPQVIMMGDAHLGNLYIEPDGTPGFLDFQSRIAPWSQEIAYFLGAALDIVDRRAWERALLAHYLERLAAYGVDAPDFDTAWTSYCRQLLFGLFVWLLNGAEFQTEVVNTANAARLGHAVIDNGTLALLENAA